MSFASEALAEFHEFYGRDNPSLGLALRQTLIEEEFLELQHELMRGSQHDREKVYKEAADLVYVLYGLDLHLGGHLDRALEAVHASNMSKLWDCEACDGLGGDLGFTDVPPCEHCDGSGKVVKRREDGKVLKPPTYEPPDLSFVHEEAPLCSTSS